MANVVVARYADGRTVKGTSLDVDVNRPRCHVRTADGTMVEIALAELKALFFVKSLEGDPDHVEAHEVPPGDPRLRGGRLVEIGFRDGEKIVGIATRYPPLKPLFFIVPVDVASNNLRILVNQAHIERMTPGALPGEA
jgi:hypothetical protein